MSVELCEQPKKSVYRRCYREAQDHRWIESQKAGFDKGDAALKEWVKLHWTGFLRARWVEHLQGKQFWAELYRTDYGLLERKFHDCPQLLSAILDQLKSGKENLDVLDWAFANGQPMEAVFEILVALDVNSSRLQHGFDPEPE